MRIKLGQDVMSISAKIEELSGQNIMLCYQCGQCTAACPMADHMELVPSMVMKHLQLGFVGDVLVSNTMWICATCYKCSVMCPKDIDIAAVMEALRRILLRSETGEHLRMDSLEKEALKSMPQIALVAAARIMSM